MPIAQPSSQEIEEYGWQIENAGLEYRDEPFNLRAGGVSHWYFDGRRVLSGAELSKTAGRFMLARAAEEVVEFSRVAGLGVGGRALATSVIIVDSLEGSGELQLIEANDDKSPGQRYGYGLHGASAKDQNVLVVDDTASSGDSLTTLVGMVREGGGNVKHAMVLLDRSGGRAAGVMREMGVGFSALYKFVESEAVILPTTR